MSIYIYLENSTVFPTVTTCKAKRRGWIYDLLIFLLTNYFFVASFHLADAFHSFSCVPFSLFHSLSLSVYILCYRKYLISSSNPQGRMQNFDYIGFLSSGNLSGICSTNIESSSVTEREAISLTSTKLPVRPLIHFGRLLFVLRGIQCLFMKCLKCPKVSWCLLFITWTEVLFSIFLSILFYSKIEDNSKKIIKKKVSFIESRMKT